MGKRMKKRSALVVISAVLMSLAVAVPIANAEEGDAEKEIPPPVELTPEQILEDEQWLGDEETRRTIQEIAEGAPGPGAGISEDGTAIIRVFSGVGTAKVEDELARSEISAEVQSSRFTADDFTALEERILALPLSEDQAFGVAYDAVQDVFNIEGNIPAEAVDRHLAEFSGAYAYAQSESSGRLSRAYDTSPFWGGSLIVGPGSAACSTGFTVIVGGTKRMVTAAHCGALTSKWYTQGNLYVGIMNNRAQFPQFDIALLSQASYQYYVYTGGNPGTGHIVSSNVGGPGLGGNYCASGAFSTETCAHAVTSMTASFCDSAGCTTPIAQITGGSVLQFGDSGGAFYGTPNTTIKIRGIVVAKSGSYGYIEPWNRIAANFTGPTIYAGTT